jgi:DNA-binding NarL/FixJ family response regulator
MTLPSVTIEKAKERIFSREAPLGIRRSALLLFDIETRKRIPLDTSLSNVLRWMDGCLEKQKRAQTMLTPLEKRILQMLVDGFTQQKVAEELGRNVRNTKRHFANIRRRLGVKTMYQAVALCVSYGWVDIDQLGN